MCCISASRPFCTDCVFVSENGQLLDDFNLSEDVEKASKKLQKNAREGGEVEKVLYGQFDDVYEITCWVLVRDDVRYLDDPMEQVKHQVLRMSQCEEVRHLHCIGKGFTKGF